MNKNNIKIIKLDDIKVEYTVEYRNVKYKRLHLEHGKLRVVVPKRSKNDVEKFILSKKKWIYKKLTEYREEEKRLADSTKNKHLSTRSMDEFKHLVDNYIEHYEKQLNVKVNRLQYRSMSRKWGSCSSLRNVTLNNDLRYLPDELVKYIVYHELTHLIVLAHNDKFFNIIKEEFPDYKECDKQLNEYQYLIRVNNQ